MVDEIVEEFLRRHPSLADQHRADNQCRIATDDLIALLNDQGISAEAVWVRGHRTASKHAAPRAMAADRHRLIRLPDGSFLDVTRRQYDQVAVHPILYASEAELAAHWIEIDRGPVDGLLEDEDWQSLRM